MTNYSDEEIREWARGVVVMHGGSFTNAMAAAILAADPRNFALIRPIAERLLAKYPMYLDMQKAKAAR